MTTKRAYMTCEHVECGSKEKVWLPYVVRENIHGLKPHSFCIRCGVVKNIGSDKAKGIGYYMNILSNIEKTIRMPGAKVRMHLIARYLEEIDGFDDKYSMSKYQQERIFTEIVKKHYHISERAIQSFF